jgi:hypothetical protein
MFATTPNYFVAYKIGIRWSYLYFGPRTYIYSISIYIHFKVREEAITSVWWWTRREEVLDGLVDVILLSL